jgi:hypothetical protein
MQCNKEKEAQVADPRTSYELPCPGQPQAGQMSREQLNVWLYSETEM